MTPYGNSSGNSGVVAFEIKRDTIVVEFRHGGKYVYDYDTTGREHVEEMKVLALEGRGLATYINKHVRNLFAKKVGGMTYKIRLATGDDVGELEPMLRGYLLEAYKAAWRGDVRRLTADLESGLLRIAIAEKNNTIAGFLAYVDTYDLHWCVPGAEVIDFYVRPGYRGLGAAVHLVAWVANETTERGALFLKSVPVGNPAIRRLYEKVALFQPSGEAYVSGRALSHLAGLSGKRARDIIKNLPRPEWSREA
jgi:GNAT superfamily N-acetyltransferase